ncbi:MAG: tyrosine-protein phosphatase [Syntrophobacteraceae bacterium]
MRNLDIPVLAQQSNVAQLSPGLSLGIDSVPNLRDVGGYETRGGKLVRRGLAYRSNQLNPVTPEDLKKIASLNLKYDFDLRTADEVQTRPDELPAGINQVWLNVVADDGQSAAALFMELLRNPREANAALSGGKVDAMYERAYREFISLPSAKQAYRQLFLSLGRPDQLPLLFHCGGGKDRTGWAAAALLSLLGVPKEKVMEDFLRSNEYVLPHYKREIDAFVGGGGDEAIALAIYGAKPEYLNAALDEMHKHYGTIENYFSEGLGMDAPAQNALRTLYLMTE